MAVDPSDASGWLGLDSEFWAAIAGAIVGGLVSVGVQLYATHVARKQRREDSDQKNRALAYSLLFKIVTIHTHFFRLDEHLKECKANAANQNPPVEAWQYVMAPTNQFSDIHFSSEEMALLLSMKADNLFNRVVSLDSQHNTLLEVVKIHRTKRETLFLNYMRPVAIEGKTITSGFADQNDYLRVRPFMMEVNDLAEMMFDMAGQYLAVSAQSMDEMNALFATKLKLGLRLTELKKAATA